MPLRRAAIPLTIVAVGAAAGLMSCFGSDGGGGDGIAEPPPIGDGGAILPEVPAMNRVLVADNMLLNAEATVPPQCYTRTEGRYNPCYTCHQLYDRRDGEDRLNRLDDGSLQGEYGFSDIGVTNHWQNLFEDRQAWLAQVSDETIRRYVDEDNYSALAANLEARGWRGFVPDLAGYQDAAAAFDERGLARDGSHWVAFNYKPFPGTFWPTNGSTDDVVIRLAAPFREIRGEYSADLYFANLALVELNLKNLDAVDSPMIDEEAIGYDLDLDGVFGTTTTIRRRPRYLGDADNVDIAFEQFPQGTELMHTVRYVGLDDDGNVVVPRRIKELRYMIKVNVLERYDIDSRYANERKEKLLGELPTFINRGELGLDNGLGWFVQGFIEDYEGELRPQSFEENLFCMGCHTSIGTTIDSTFSFARKVEGAAGWRYIDLHGMRDVPSLAETDGDGEILHYLRRSGGGSEFRANPEMVERWFNADGTVNESTVRAADVYTLIAPSARRALDLNKAYTHIVRHQSFIYGRDASWLPVDSTMYRGIDLEIPPLESAYRYYGWDIRLNWDAD